MTDTSHMRTPTVVPKEVLEVQSPRVKLLLRKREELLRRGDRAALRSNRELLRQAGFKLSGIPRLRPPRLGRVRRMRFTAATDRRLALLAADRGKKLETLLEELVTAQLDVLRVPARLPRRR